MMKSEEFSFKINYCLTFKLLTLKSNTTFEHVKLLTFFTKINSIKVQCTKTSLYVLITISVAVGQNYITPFLEFKAPDMSDTNEITELEDAIQYILQQIRQNQFQRCRSLREVSDRYLRALLRRAMTILANF